MSVIGQGMGADQERLSVIAVNLANVQTPAYKREFVNGAAFEARLDALERLGRGQVAAAPPPAAYADMRPGAVRYTGRPLDVALTGENTFIVLARAGRTLYGRQGALQVDGQGRLTTAGGDLVMGQGGEIRLTSAAPRIDPQGNVYDQERFVDRLSLASFAAPQSLQRLGGGVYGAGQARGQPLRQDETALRQGYLEGSNVDPAREMAAMIEVMRHVESLQKSAQFIDEMTGRAVQKLGEF